LDREIGRFLALENPTRVDADRTIFGGKMVSIIHQTADRGELAMSVGNTSTLRQRSPLLWAHPRDIISQTRTPAGPGETRQLAVRVSHFASYSVARRLSSASSWV
jgi:hypothetical protein